MMDDMQAIISMVESLGMIGLMLLWLRDKNDQLKHERESRHQLSDDVLEDWKELKKQRHISDTD